MTTELVLILAFFAVIIGGVVFGDSGPESVFSRSAPKLAARIEKNIETGTGWLGAAGAGNWGQPTGAPPGN